MAEHRRPATLFFAPTVYKLCVQQVVPAAVHDNSCEVHDMPSAKVEEAPLSDKELHNNGVSKEQEIISKEQEAITIDTADDGGHDIAHEVEAKLSVRTPADAKEEPGEEEDRRRLQAKRTPEKAASKAVIVPVEPEEEVVVVVTAPVAPDHQEEEEMVEVAAVANGEDEKKGEQQVLEDKEINACEKTKIHKE
ncbi:hypothetical protein E2562_027592 [Oryza meyeriana var. granulata]|uniref:Uncharacterized protein n=1 Tax=Oryza meyeriana var. granulata TaxID=110450 RepID=A0A6G1DQ10_9ORYZ|nr:hypothetical protein E2562_027592 [Oryza meyeriana var. granulata]